MKLLSRKDIAQLIDVSVDQVRKNEQRWGLVRVTYNSRFVRYRRGETVAALGKFGLLEKAI